MVYCGKPSRGCQNCKTRRIKCDEARPTCGQCRKSNRVCPGYPDEFDLIFRNETSAVKRRAERAFTAASSSSKKSKSSSKGNRTSASPSEQPTLSWDTTTTATTDSPRSDSTEELSPRPFALTEIGPNKSYEWTYESPSDLQELEDLDLDDDDIIQLSSDQTGAAVQDMAGFDPWYSPPASLTLSREMNATTFFFRNYAMTPMQRDSMRGYIEILVPMYQNSADDSVLHLATHATALAALSNSYMARQLRMDAHRAYGKALRAAAPLVKDPAAAKSDELLMSILLFSLYEAITATNDTRTLWTHHISGAVALVKLRGEEQLKNRRSLHLFRAVRAAMLTSSIVQNKTVEDFPGKKGWRCDEDMDDVNAANRLTLICLKLPNIKFYAHSLLAREKTPKTVSDMINLIRTAKDIDCQLENWALSLPPEWAYKAAEICTDEPQTDDELLNARFWTGPVHVYQDLSVANIWNDYRVSRIFCQAVILGCIAALPKSAKNEQIERISASAVHITQEMVNDFCSALPFMFGYDAKQRTRSTGQDEGSFRATGAYFAAWPLFVTKKIPCIPTRQKKWLEGRLFHIGKTFGLNEEQVLNFAKKHILTSGPSFG